MPSVSAKPRTVPRSHEPELAQIPTAADELAVVDIVHLRLRLHHGSMRRRMPDPTSLAARQMALCGRVPPLPDARFGRRSNSGDGTDMARHVYSPVRLTVGPVGPG
jgi:hypothetical protein